MLLTDSVNNRASKLKFKCIIGPGHQIIPSDKVVGHTNLLDIFSANIILHK